MNDWRTPDANGWSDIAELNIYAEKIIIREALHFPHTNVTIYAKELIFEDMPGRAFSSINTSPEMWDIGNNERGKNGENAGNITLYIKDFKQSVPAKRFILVGGKGQQVNWNTKSPEWLEGAVDTRTPGNGGNGGKLTSTINVSDFCDVIHGSAGIQVDENKKIIGAGQHGNKGSFVLENKEFKWLHPNFVSAIVKHAKDAYLNIHNGFAYYIFSEYTQRIADFKASGEWGTLSEEEKMDLNTAETEMQAVIYRINQNLDYFGNPVGWVPMLSFEVNKAIFEQEIEKAIRVMYLSYWIKCANRTNAERLAGFGTALIEERGYLAANKEFMNQLLDLLPRLQDDATDLEQQIQDVINKINRLRDELMAKAKSNIQKKNKLNKIAGCLNVIAKVAPVVCSVIPGIGTAVGAAIGGVVSLGANIFSKATGATDTYGYGDAVGGFLNTATGFLQGGGFSNIFAALNSINTSSIGSAIDSAKDAYNNISGAVDPLVKSVENLHKTFAQSSAPKDQVTAEFNRLMAESPEYRALESEFVALDVKKQGFITDFTSMMKGLSVTNANIQNNIAAIDGLGRNLFDEHSKHDLRALQYVDDMERRAKERLLHYHYYMAKAYEYRMLKPYPHSTAGLDLSGMFEKLQTMVETGSQTLTEANFKTLAVIYDEQISSVVKTIVDYYNSNRPGFSSNMRFSATANDLADLNAGRGFNLNLYERGQVLTNHENARIVNFKIHDIKVRLEGDQNPSHAYFEILMEHSGRSMMRNNGQIYWFDHINNRNENPITWGANYDVKHKILDEHVISPSDLSLLYSILTNLKQTDNIMIFAHPGAWSDIYVSKNDAVSGNTKMIIEELTFELQYSFVQRPTNNRNLDVYAGDVDSKLNSLSPLIEISRTDIGGRTNGRGTLYRTYARNSSVNLTAQEEYGRYKFVNWTNKYGTVMSTKATISTTLSTDTLLKANYKYMGPILSMKDSVLVGKNAQVVSVKIENKGSEEMEWEVVSNSPWVKIISKTTGVDTDYITLEIEENPSATAIRKGSITITAPETAEYSKEFKVVQSNENINKVEQVAIQSLKIIRNQGTDNYSVALGETARNISVDVYSMNGQLVLKKYFYGTSTFDFNLSHCSQGVYLVKIMYDGKPYIQKIIK